MSDMGEIFRDVRDGLKARKVKDGIECPRCKELQPKRCATVLLPGWTCKVDGYRRPHPNDEKIN